MPIKSLFIIPENKRAQLKSLTDTLKHLENLSVKKRKTSDDPASLSESTKTIDSQVKEVLKIISPNERLLKMIPSPSIISFVRPNWQIERKIGTNINISHQGLYIKKGKHRWLRHASTFQKRVIDEDFVRYLIRRLNHRHVKGIHISAITSPKR